VPILSLPILSWLWNDWFQTAWSKQRSTSRRGMFLGDTIVVDVCAGYASGDVMPARSDDTMRAGTCSDDAMHAAQVQR